MGKPLACGRVRSRAFLFATTLLTSGLCAPAILAQELGSQGTPPVRPLVDANGVDILRGTFTPELSDVSIGPNDHRGLFYGRVNGTYTQFGSIELVGGTYVVTIGGRADSFTASGGGFVSTEGEGASLTLVSGTYTYTARDGTVAIFASNAGYSPAFRHDDLARLSGIVFPDGTSRSFTWIDRRVCDGEVEQGTCMTGTYFTAVRLQSVTNSHGYQLKMKYALDKPKRAASLKYDITLDEYYQWTSISSVTAINNAVEACDPAADTCSLTGAWPKAQYAGSTVTDALGRPIKSYVTLGQDGSGNLTATRDGVTFTYRFNVGGVTGKTTVTDPAGKVRTYVSDTAKSRLSSFTDELSRTTNYAYDTSGRVTEIARPEGNKLQYGYDARGNVTSTTAVAKPGSGLASITSSATFPSSCTNAKTCNKPITSTDAGGRVTDYDYDTTHGGLTKVTLPAPAIGGVRPETRYSYSLISGEYLMTGISVCRTLTSCAGTADEVKTVIGYNTQGQPASVTSGAGDNSLLATTTIAYDSRGNATYVDGPLSGTADTTRTIYDAADQVVGIIGPDPDGGGALKHRAQRMIYNSDGIVTKVEQGTTNGQSDGDWAAFVPLQQVESTVGTDRRKTRDTMSAGGTTYAVTDYSYDALGRPLCTAIRMNLGSLTQGACALNSAGSFGPDRITKLTYDDAGQTIAAEMGYGVAGFIIEGASYSLNGATTTVTDGENNRTTYVYDGHDRLSRTRYPVATKGALASSTTDYEELTYDAVGNITSRRLRDGNILGFQYDRLGRLTFIDNPLSANVMEPDVSNTYDSLGQLLQAVDTNGHFARFTYDALGRTTSEESTNGGTKTMQYDLAGRRTRLTWPDAFYASYDYLVTGETSAIRENGATSGPGVLGVYAYDDLGRRTSLTRGNGTATSYGYDGASRLLTVADDMAGTGGDQTVTLGYNPAAQIISRSGTNDSYAWGGHVSGSTASSVDGVNRLTAVGGVTPTFDGRLNMTTDGVATYGYNLKNQLVAKDGIPQFYYEPLGRLTQQWNGGGIMDWVGNEIIADLGARRYVHGPGTDEILVWYESMGTTNRKWLHTDERGSVVAVSDGSGNLTSINRYDEYGVPAPTNVGRFQYTGQAWLPELGLYYYKARMYAPNLGRFMQTDPIGLGDGVNMYAYVSGDPVNASDSSGLFAELCTLSRSISYCNADAAGAAASSNAEVGRNRNGGTRAFIVMDKYSDGTVGNFRHVTRGPEAPMFTDIGLASASYSNGEGGAWSEQSGDIVVTGKRCSGVWFGDVCVGTVFFDLEDADGNVAVLRAPNPILEAAEQVNEVLTDKANALADCQRQGLVNMIFKLPDVNWGRVGHDALRSIGTGSISQAIRKGITGLGYAGTIRSAAMGAGGALIKEICGL